MKLAATGEEAMKTSDSGIRLEGNLFDNNTKAIVWGQQTKAIQVDVNYIDLSIKNLYSILRRIPGHA